MAILPLQLARVSNLLRTSTTSSAISRNQALLLEVQNELSSGTRVNQPSDDPAAAAVIQQLQKTLEQRDAYATNLKTASSHLGTVDSTLSDVSDLLQQAQDVGSANVGSDVTPDQRQAAAEIVKNLYSQVLSLANKSSAGMYLFAGDRSTSPPFVEQNGGVRFVGSDAVLANTFDENTVLPFMVDGGSVFGGLASRVQGTADLSPSISATTRLVDLGGATGEGVRPNNIQINNGTTTTTVNLAACDTLGDVVNAINAAGISGVTATIPPGGTGLQLNAAPGTTIAVTDPVGGTTAADLGILQPTPGAAGSPVVGADVNAKVTLLTPLSALRAGAGISTSGLIITNGQKTATINLAGVTTVEGMLNAINGAGVGVRAQVNAAGTGIDILNEAQGTDLTIAENGGTTAADLGVRSFTASTPLADLNFGKGVRTGAGADIQITKRDGSTFQVDLDPSATVQDVIDKINTAATAAGGGLSASFASTGNGIVLTDSTGGSGVLAVASINYAYAAQDLGLSGAAAGNTLAGADVNAVRADGVFGNLGRLRDALQSSDQQGITAAVEGLKADFDRIARIRGETGARVQELESRQSRLEDENVAAKSMLSGLKDTDFTDAISRFQTLQTSLQAALQSGATLLNQSLLDFLQ